LTKLDKGKAKGFNSLGYNTENKEILSKLLLEQADHCEDITKIIHTDWGTKYEIVRIIKGINGKQGRLITSWEVKGGNSKRLVTAIMQPFK